MNTLYLTTEEKKKFEALPSKVKEGWDVADETQVFEDSDDLRRVRLQLMRFTSPALVAARSALMNAASAEAMGKVLMSIDQASITEREWLELCYGLGPQVLSLVIAAMLSHVRTDEEMEVLAGFSGLRHEILDVFLHPVSLPQ